MKYATKEEANKAIAEKVEAAYALINEAEEIADENEVSFKLEISYGMGGTFYPKDEYNRYYKEDWDDASESGAWRASSQSC